MHSTRNAPWEWKRICVCLGDAVVLIGSIPAHVEFAIRF
jgi:hypothetical protein